jgi:V8-like Glu-specific endopeptidase
MTLKKWSTRAIALVVLAGAAAVALGDEPILPDIPSIVVPVDVDSGFVSWEGPMDEYRVVYSTGVYLPGAEWLRLRFGETVLAGDPGADGAYLRITSVADGSQQILNAESLGWWGQTSAYFNGDEVIVEVLARGSSGESRVRIVGAEAGQAPNGGTGYGDRSICGSTDDRTLSTIKGNARLMSVGCTAWLINDVNRQFLTAGHCTVTATSVVQFNVPLSMATGSLRHPPATDQVPVQIASNQGMDGGIGNDWRYFGTLPNSNTGITAFQHQGEVYTLATAAPPPSGQTIRITGYGTVSAPVSLTWNQVQKTHTGPYTELSGTRVRYATDTTGGNSGSPVLNVNTGQAIGIHTHAGCTVSGGSNQGTAIQHTGLQNALNNPLGVCRSGAAPATGTILVAGDLNNNIGLVGTTSPTFGKLGLVERTFQGMAANHNAGFAYGVDAMNILWRIDPDGTVTELGSITGTSLTITGLGYDPGAGVLYGIAGATGQLYRINTTTRVATPVGSPNGGNIGALEFDHRAGVLYGLDDASTGTRLITFNTTTGAAAVRGVLGTGTDCNGLAYDPETSQLYTIDAPTGRLLRINPANGAAVSVGLTNGAFGSAFGMTSLPRATGCTTDFDGDGDVGTDADIEAFFACLGGNCCGTCASADFDQDGDWGTDADIESFFRMLAGGPC